MAVRVADTLKQQNDLKTFPVAFSEDIWIDQNKGAGDANYKDLQTLYNEGALGGSGLPEPETKDKLLLSTENAETSELEWSQVDKSKVVEIPLYETKEAAEADIANLTDGQIIATKDEGNENAKPVDVVEKGNLHAVTSNAVAENLSYSTEEVKTGGTWIDGKPIYRKVINCGALPDNSAKLVPAGISNMGYLLSLKGTAFTTNWGYDTYLSIPHIAIDSSDSVQVTYEDDNVRLLTAGARSYYTVSYITLEYTKTTD